MSSKPRDPRWDPRPGDVLLDANQLTRKVVRTERSSIYFDIEMPNGGFTETMCGLFDWRKKRKKDDVRNV